MDGGYLDIWLQKPLEIEQRLLIKRYELYLQSFEKGYSFIYDIRSIDKDIIVKDRNQIINAIGFLPEQVLNISGLAEPLFRSIEVLLRHFKAYLKIPLDSDRIKGSKGQYHKIVSYTDIYEVETEYHLVDWEFVSTYFNSTDSEEIKKIYSMDKFLSIT